MSEYRWISVSDAMPEHGDVVLLSYVSTDNGRRFYVIGHYLERFKSEAVGDDDWEATEYSEELDNYFYLPGWYEQQLNWDDYGYIAIHEGEVDYWMPIPKMEE